MDDTYFKVFRRLLDDPQWLAEPFTRGQAWIDLIGLANWADSTVFIRGQKVDVKRGQVGRSQVALAQRWKWDRQKVQRFLKELVLKQQITQHSSNVFTMIEIQNYEGHQAALKPAPQQQKKSTKPAKKKEPPPAPEDIAGTFPCKGDPGEWILTKKKLAEYTKTYIGMDVRQECKKAKQWLVDNPLRQKTHGGMTRYLNSWISRANDNCTFQKTGAGFQRPAPSPHGEQGTVTKDDLPQGAM